MVIANPKIEHRWFIWTIVFLLASGVTLVSYIIITGINDSNQNVMLTLPIHKVKK